MHKHTCTECSQPVIGRKAEAKYCSHQCKYRAAYKRKRAERKAERECSVTACGKKHLAKGYCRQHYRTLANPDKPRDRRTPITCIDCGTEALKHYGTKTCLERCQDCAIAQRGERKRWPSSRIFISTCGYCANAFSGNTLRKYCSEHCYQETRRDKYSSSVTCGLCGIARTDKHKRYCDQCREARAWESNRAGGLKRRALEKQATVDNVRPLTLFARDKWICGLCEEPVDPNLRHPHQMSASVDHIVPISKGGDHSYANTQCAHLRCNVRKGARLG